MVLLRRQLQTGADGEDRRGQAVDVDDCLNGGLVTFCYAAEIFALGNDDVGGIGASGDRFRHTAARLRGWGRIVCEPWMPLIVGRGILAIRRAGQTGSRRLTDA